MEKYASVAAPHTESAVWKGRRHGPRGRRVGAASPEPSCCGASGGSSVCDAPDGSTLSASGLASVRSLGTRAPYLGCGTCGPTNVSRLVVGGFPGSGFPAGVASPPAWPDQRRSDLRGAARLAYDRGEVPPEDRWLLCPQSASRRLCSGRRPAQDGRTRHSPKADAFRPPPRAPAPGRFSLPASHEYSTPGLVLQPDATRGGTWRRSRFEATRPPRLPSWPRTSDPRRPRCSPSIAGSP